MENSPVETGLFLYLKYSMRKFKIFITIFLIYEFAMLTILQIPRYCSGFFKVSFCDASFKYFLMCLLVPCFVALFVWWIPEISRMFCGKCQCEVPHEKNIPDKISEITSKQIIERLITTAIVAGVNKFASEHPKTKKKIQEIAKVVAGKK